MMAVLRPKHGGAQGKVLSVVCVIPIRELKSKFKKVPINARYCNINFFTIQVLSST